MIIIHIYVGKFNIVHIIKALPVNSDVRVTPSLHLKHTDDNAYQLYPKSGLHIHNYLWSKLSNVSNTTRLSSAWKDDYLYDRCILFNFC